MDAVKQAVSEVDADRLVRNFLNAVDAFKTPLALILSTRAEQERKPEAPKQDPAAAPRTARPTVQSATQLKAPGTDAVSVGNKIKAATASERPRGLTAFDEFCKDEQLLKRLVVTPDELQHLSSAELLGSVKSKLDIAFILGVIRRTSKTGMSSVDNGAEEPERDFRDVSERLRREAVVKLEADSMAGAAAHAAGRPSCLAALGITMVAGLTKLLSSQAVHLPHIDLFHFLLLSGAALVLVPVGLHLKYRISMRRFKVQPRVVSRWPIGRAAVA